MENESIEIKQFFSLIIEKVLPVCLQYRNGYKSMNLSYKEDTTLLTDADIEIQSIIVKLIQTFEPNAYIIAEEDSKINNPRLETATSLWIIDPIDGTAQFSNLNSREYCISICKYERGLPFAALIIMPQLGLNFTPIVAEAFCNEKLIFINDEAYDYSDPEITKNVSCTRSRGSEPHAFENTLIGEGYLIKTSTTSQSIDLLRTACQLNEYSDLNLPKFDFFFRKNQKIWDGAPGFCFNYVTGSLILDKEFKELLPLDGALLNAKTPTIDKIFVGSQNVIAKVK